MLRLRAVVVLMLLAAALAPLAIAQDDGLPAHINPTHVFTVEDPAGDVTVQEEAAVEPLPNDGDFDDVDLVRVRLYEDRGPAGDRAPTLVILLEPAAETNGQTDYTVNFTVSKGPTSLPSSTASGRNHTFSAVSNGGEAQARVTIPLSQLNATGGDVLTGLRAFASRTEGRLLPLFQDDQTGRDEAPDAGVEAPTFTFFRPVQPALVDVQVLGIGDTSGASATVADSDDPVAVRLSIRNLGLDPISYGFSLRSDPPLADPPAFTQELRTIPAGASEERTVQVSLAGMTGAVRLTFVVTTEDGKEFTGSGTVTVAAAPQQREVKPAGLDFLTPAAEGMNLDGPFDEFAELVLLALLVLLAILVVFLLCALAPSTLAGAAEPSAPPLAREEAPPGVLPEAASAAAREPEPEPEPVAKSKSAAKAARVTAAGAAAAPAAIRIDEVTHQPDAPEPGEAVSTEVLLRNDGAGRQVRVVLSVDGTDADEATLSVAARATKAVRLRWTAGDGENRVRVRVLPA